MESAAGPRGEGPVVDNVGDSDGPQAVIATLRRLGLQIDHPVLVSVGGAAGMSGEHRQALRQLLADHVLPLLSRRRATVVDGGTSSGVMQVMGEAVAATGTALPLLGVAARGTVHLPGHPPSLGDEAPLDPNHTAVLLVPGNTWGDESPWIATVARLLAGSSPSATLVVNGGQITYRDIHHSLDARRPVITIAGTGRTADAITAALRGQNADPRAQDVAAHSDLVHSIDLTDGPGLAQLLDELLTTCKP